MSEGKGDGFRAEKSLESYLANEQFHGARTNAGTLESIKLLQDMADRWDMSGGSDVYKGIGQTELKYYQSAAQALASDPVLQMKFGQTFDGMETLVGIMKMQYSEREATERLASYLPDRPSTIPAPRAKPAISRE